MSVPIWPVALLSIHRTIHKWLLYGFLTGLWIATADIIYAYISRSGLLYIQDFLIDYKLWVHLIGSAVFLILGIATYFSHKKNFKSSHTKKNVFKNYWTGLLLNLANPFNIIFLWVIFSKIIVVWHKINFWSDLFLFLGIFIWASIRWFGLNGIVARFHIKMESLYVVNKIIWILIILLSIVSFIHAIWG